MELRTERITKGVCVRWIVVFHVSDRHCRAASDPTGDQPQHFEDEDDGSGLHRELSTNDLFIKDAFLVFRALCKLTMKPLNSERYGADCYY